MKSTTGWLAMGIAAVIGQAEARAQPCATSPACHLQNGKNLLGNDPRHAAEELLASYRLDERTDTLVLYATALQQDHRYALALETWKRVIVFRDSELESAKETAGSTSGRRHKVALAAATRAEQQSEQAAEAILKLWPNIGRVHVRVAPGQHVKATRDGVELDLAQDVLVNAGHDELMFTRKDGSIERVVVQVAAGSIIKIDAPTEAIRARPVQPEPRPVARPVAPAPVAKPVAPEPAPAPAEQPEPAPAPLPTLATEPADTAPRSILLSRVGMGLVAGAVVAGGVAGGFGYFANREFNDAKSAGCSGNGQCPFGHAADLAHESNDRAHVAQYTAIGAGVLAATGVTLWYLGSRKTHHPITELTLHVAPSSTAISGRF
ncbi:MAG TPA: hypothetical protein VH165_26865 [Kofleriaceae bacterium]|jgi:hypothetical protein|nr:hypothetical protein [Kofleriaceae bacterium]